MQKAKKIIFSAITIVLIFSFWAVPSAQAQRNFGGTIVFQRYCLNGGILVTIATPTPGDFFWVAGNLPFSMHVIPHVGQQLLGMATMAPTMPCIINYYPTVIYGYGAIILFHGSSI